MGEIWDEIITHISRWKKQIPDMPEINFDTDSNDSADKMKQLDNSVLRKLFIIELDDVLAVLFSNCETLKLLSVYFASEWQASNRQIFQTLQTQCDETIKRLQQRKNNNVSQ